MEKKFIDYVKSLEESKIIKKGSHKNAKVMELIAQICQMTDKEIKAENNANVTMIHDEYVDWLETYRP